MMQRSGGELRDPVHIHIIRSYEFGHSRANVIRRLDRLSIALGLDRERCRLWALVQ